MDLGLRDRVYVITGGSKGLGFAAAAALVADGARVVVSSRSEESVRAAVGQLGPESTVGLAADNADPAMAQRLADAALERWGRIDGALISVGGPPPTAALAATDEQWRESFETVFLGAVRLSRSLMPHLGAGAAIAFVLSTSSKSPIGGLAISNGLRPGLAMWAKELADEVGPDGIRVVGLMPGRVLTDRTISTNPDPADRAAIAAQIPLRRYGNPEEFGKVAAFVLSPAASYLTGCMVPIDGGALRML
jgi:3-oxoacyl-[acyl-carrier protein] reductase